MDPGSAVRFQIGMAVWPESRENGDIGPRSDALIEEGLAQLKLEYGDDNMVYEENSLLEEVEGIGLRAYMAGSEGEAVKKCIWFEVLMVERWR
jgi:hypothetical protein